MTEKEFKQIVAEYPFIYEDFGFYYMPGFKLKILDVRAGCLWFGPCGGKTQYLRWRYVTPNTLRKYLNKQKERYERRQLENKKATVKEKLNKLKEDF